MFIDFLWQTYIGPIFWKEFVPYCFYVAMLVMLISNPYLSYYHNIQTIDFNGDIVEHKFTSDEHRKNCKIIEISRAAIILLLMIKYIYREVMEVINDWKSYLMSFWNMLDITSIILNLYCLNTIW